ncbi:putative transposase [Canicola haemoglobinophilus]|uniref:Mutator family transposase n=1 Tax=Canicola haemoglobinophilus TaxID=733 RepID=A0AB38H7K2_9PAST|nr:IS256 family transposase [Canicola haemoglobinophilus]STO68227.1 putative transposase [Canicola haemoglobinophilus]
MNEKQLHALAAEFAKTLKTPEDLNQFSRMLKKITVEAALNGELTDHLGYEKHQPRKGKNARNGYTSKTVICDEGEIEIDTPRDRDGSFEPQLIKKNQTRITGMDEQIIALYAKVLSNQEIVEMFKELYDADVSTSLISRVTDSVKERVIAWQSRALDAIYPIVYLDCIVVKVRQDGRIINKSVFVALGVNLEGHKELLGLWIAENEGAKFWANVLTELQNRGLKDIFIACVDGLKGFPEAINAVYPQTKIQLCIVHLVRNSLKYVSWKDYKAVTADLKGVYQAPTEAQARENLTALSQKWQAKYPLVAKCWEDNWANIATFFDYPNDIRKAIYTTNAVESLNSVIRRVIKKRNVFPTDDSVFKVIWLAMKDASKKWTMPIQNWKLAMNRFMIDFGARLDEHR